MNNNTRKNERKSLMFNARCLLILTLLLTSTYFYGCGEETPLIDSADLEPGTYKMIVSQTATQNAILKSIRARVDDGFAVVELLLADETIISPRISTGNNSQLLVRTTDTDWELLVEVTDFVGSSTTDSGTSSVLGHLLSAGTSGPVYYQYNGRILEVLKPEGIDLFVAEAPIVSESPIRIKVCQVGNVIQPGRFCEDGRGGFFTVFGDGSAAYLFNRFSNYPPKNRSFHAKKRDDGTWKILSVTPGASEFSFNRSYNGRILKILKPEDIVLPVAGFYCQVGDVLQPGDSCLDGTGNRFRVHWDESASYRDMTGYLSIKDTTQNGSFHAKYSGRNRWKILSVTPKEDLEE